MKVKREKILKAQRTCKRTKPWRGRAHEVRWLRRELKSFSRLSEWSSMRIIGGDMDDGEEEAITEVTTDQAVALIEELEITADY